MTDTTPVSPSALQTRSPVSAIRHAPSHGRLWIVAGLGIAADLWSKDWAFRSLGMGEIRPVLDGWLSFKLSLNPGALFGIGAGMAPIFVGASVLALLFVLYLFAQSTRQHRILHVALGLVLAGAVGNLYDRTVVLATVVRTTYGRQDVGTLVKSDNHTLVVGDFPSGAHPRTYAVSQIESRTSQPVVRDFISIDAKAFGYRLWPWIFNIADAMLVVGVGALLINFWSDRRSHLPPAPQEQDRTTAEPAEASVGSTRVSDS